MVKSIIACKYVTLHTDGDAKIVENTVTNNIFIDGGAFTSSKRRFFDSASALWKCAELVLVRLLCSHVCVSDASMYDIQQKMSGYRRVEVVVSYKMDSTANQCPMPRKVLECSIAMRTGGPYRMRYTVHHTARRLAECNGPSLSATRARARPIALSGPCSSPAHESMQVCC